MRKEHIEISNARILYFGVKNKYIGKCNSKEKRMAYEIETIRQS